MSAKLAVNLPDGWHRIPACTSPAEHKKLGYRAAKPVYAQHSWYHFVYVKDGEGRAMCGFSSTAQPVDQDSDEYSYREYFQASLKERGAEGMLELLGVPPLIDWSDTLELQ